MKNRVVDIDLASGYRDGPKCFKATEKPSGNLLYRFLGDFTV